MGAGEIIALVGLILFWVTTLITFWVKIKIKITELDLKIKNLDNKLNTHMTCCETQQEKNQQKFSNIQTEMKDNYKEVLSKLDILIEKFADFRVYLEKRVK